MDKYHDNAIFRISESGSITAKLTFDRRMDWLLTEWMSKTHILSNSRATPCLDTADSDIIPTVAAFRALHDVDKLQPPCTCRSSREPRVSAYPIDMPKTWTQKKKKKKRSRSRSRSKSVLEWRDIPINPSFSRMLNTTQISGQRVLKTSKTRNQENDQHPTALWGRN